MGDVRVAAVEVQQDDCVFLSIASTYDDLFTGEYSSIAKAVGFIDT